jgi:E3 ubiquitin-protein ligase SHPRH
LKTHAPSIKVLFYEGWNKVLVPIASSEFEKERVRRLKAQDKAKKKPKKKAKKKAGKGKGKGKALAADDSDSDPNEEEDEIPGEESTDWYSYVHSFDVVITTYATLRTDLNVARAPPKRPRREDVVYSNVERPRSPLVMCEWYRVVMDEVQMVGGGHAEYVEFLLYFIHRFLMSNTGRWYHSFLAILPSQYQERQQRPRSATSCTS